MRFFVIESLSTSFFHHFIQTQTFKEYSNLIVFSEGGVPQYVYDKTALSTFYNYNSTRTNRDVIYLQMMNLIDFQNPGSDELTAFFNNPLNMHHFYFNWYKEARVGGDAFRVLFCYDTPVYPVEKEPLTSIWRDSSTEIKNSEERFSIAVIQTKSRWKLLLSLREETFFVKGSVLNGRLASQKIVQVNGDVMLVSFYGKYHSEKDLLEVKLTWENDGRYAAQSYFLDRVAVEERFPRKQSSHGIRFRF